MSGNSLSICKNEHFINYSLFLGASALYLYNQKEPTPFYQKVFTIGESFITASFLVYPIINDTKNASRKGPSLNGSIRRVVFFILSYGFAQIVRPQLSKTPPPPFTFLYAVPMILKLLAYFIIKNSNPKPPPPKSTLGSPPSSAYSAHSSSPSSSDTIDFLKLYTPTCFESLLAALDKKEVINYQNATYECYTEKYDDGWSVFINKMKNGSTDPVQQIDLFSEDGVTIEFIKIGSEEVYYTDIKQLPKDYQEVIKLLCEIPPLLSISPSLSSPSF